MNRFAAAIADPDVPYEITMTVAARDGWLACESVTVAGRPDGPAVGAASLRSLALSLYMQRIREELAEYRGGGLILKETGRTDRTVSYDLPVIAEDWDTFDFAQMRRAVHSTKITAEMAAGAYLEALASPDPEKNRRPTAAAAEKLGASRGHISRLLTQARRDGIEGLGPQRPTRRGASGEVASEPVVRQPVVAAVVTSGLGVLVGRRNDGSPPWTFIAGEVEPGERPEDAAMREVKEETGLLVKHGRVIGERVHPQSGRTMIYLAARPTHGTDVFVGDRAELAEVRWVSLAEADELLPGMFAPVRRYLARELAKEAGK